MEDAAKSLFAKPDTGRKRTGIATVARVAIRWLLVASELHACYIWRAEQNAIS